MADLLLDWTKDADQRVPWLIRRRRMCIGCGIRRALYKTRDGRVRGDKGHTLCFRCHRGLVNRVRALRTLRWSGPSAESCAQRMVPERGLTMDSRC